MEALALADDLTGALEAGALLAQAGLPATVTLDPERAGELLVIDTETRHASAAGARALHRRIAQRHTGRIYKKTDSTLRGNIAAELAGLADARPGAVIEYVPAYPRVGRTVRDGLLYVDGVPLAETAFAHDPLNPVRSCSVKELVVDVPAVRVWDAETDEDLARIGSAIGDAPIVASPAGFIPYWAAALAGPRTAPEPLPAIESCVLVCGSLHPRSREQAAHAAAAGWAVIVSEERRPGEEAQTAARLADQAADRMPVDAFIVFGGDTARAILRRFQCTDIQPLAELLPGVPISRIHVDGRPLILITKAGGFGPPDLISRIHATLKRNR
jgi:uncharacterized protein YgbK (DUF1537 family)